MQEVNMTEKNECDHSDSKQQSESMPGGGLLKPAIMYLTRADYCCRAPRNIVPLSECLPSTSNKIGTSSPPQPIIAARDTRPQPGAFLCRTSRLLAPLKVLMSTRSLEQGALWGGRGEVRFTPKVYEDRAVKHRVPCQSMVQ